MSEMSLSASTTHPPTTAGAEAAYRPGACNIGSAEIARRRRAGHVGVLATLVLLAVLVVIGAPPLTRLLLAIPAAVGAAGYLQVWQKFCAAYGFLGVFNFDELGQLRRSDDRGARARDRAKALRIGLESFAIALAVAALAVLLPI